MTPRHAGALLLCLGLLSCAPARLVLLPGPPAEVRKETAARPAAPPVPPAPPAERTLPAAPPAPAPSPVNDAKRYEAAIARTREAIAKRAWKSAIPAWAELERGPYRRDAVFHRGVLLQLAGDLDEAKSLYRTLAEETPPYEPAAANLLGILLLRGERSEAVALAGRLLPDPRSPPPGMLPELEANLAAVLVEEGRLEEAALRILSLQAHGFDLPALSWNLAVLAYRKGDRAAAKRLADRLPADIVSLWPVAASRAAWEPDGGGNPALDNVPAGEPRLFLLAANLRAYRAFRNGSLEEAEAILRTADPRNGSAEVLTNLGILLAERERWKEAREVLERAVREDPALAAGWRNLGIFLELYAGEPAKARECYERYTALHGAEQEEVAKWAEWLGRSAP
ncbi:MAG: hypothetical protein Kow00128_04290 [Deltaproteobacteria bacterium]